MRFLANENFPLASVHLLRKNGHDIASMTEDSPGATDLQVLQRAYLEKYIILTFDRDYGELIFRHLAPTPPGVIYFRLDPQTPEEPGEHVLRLLTIKGISYEGNFSVTDGQRIRQRRLA